MGSELGVVAVPRLALFTLLAAGAPCAHAHAAALHDAPWSLEPWLVAMLATAAALYAIGVRALWRKAGTGRGIRTAQVARFASGWLVLAVALLSPIDTMGARYFSVHMVQHELLMVLAAPLLVLGRPLEAWAWGLPPTWTRALARTGQAPWLSRSWAFATGTMGAWSLHALALWLWHVPVLFDAALASEPVHALQHASFLGTALAFWWAIFGRGVHRPDGASLASLFTTMIHTSALGALLTLAPTVWYATYATGAGGPLTPLEDQQLGGLVMWIPAGFAYVVTGLAIVASWLDADRARLTPRGLPRRTGDSSAPSSRSSC